MNSLLYATPVDHLDKYYQYTTTMYGCTFNFILKSALPVVLECIRYSPNKSWLLVVTSSKLIAQYPATSQKLLYLTTPEMMKHDNPRVHELSVHLLHNDMVLLQCMAPTHVHH